MQEIQDALVRSCQLHCAPGTLPHSTEHLPATPIAHSEVTRTQKMPAPVQAGQPKSFSAWATLVIHVFEQWWR